jgi:hypothetical protein
MTRFYCNQGYAVYFLMGRPPCRDEVSVMSVFVCVKRHMHMYILRYLTTFFRNVHIHARPVISTSVQRIIPNAYIQPKDKITACG